MSHQANLPRPKIEAFCHKWKIAELSLFGSILRDDFSPDSDVDLLVTFEPGIRWGILELLEMEEELKAITGRQVDIVNRKSIEASGNWIRRDSILKSATPYYVAG